MSSWVGRQSPWLNVSSSEPLLPLEDSAKEVVWQTERAKAGKRPWQWIELEVDRCINTYGAAPCLAALGVTGAVKCMNSWVTCQDQANYRAAPFWVRLAEPNADAPREFDFGEDDGLQVFLPLLQSISFSPGLPNPGETLGQRSSVAVRIGDAPHHDRGIDKYIAERGYDAMTRSTFMRKLKTRFPHYVGRRLRWYQGYITDETSFSNFRRREFIIEKFEGPDADGRTQVQAKDVLKLLDDDRAQAPLKSTGTLLSAMAVGAAPTTVDVVTSNLTEYDLAPGTTVDYFRIGEEIFTYTGTSIVSGNVRLSGVSRTAPSPYTTTKQDHSAGDLVQRCLYLAGTVPDVLYALFTEFGGVDSTLIPKGDWDAEADLWQSGDLIQRLIAEPEGVKSLVDEVISQTLTWGVWYDDLDGLIHFRAIHPPDVGEVVATLTDAANLVAGSVTLVDKPDDVVNEVQVLYGQIDPVVQKDRIDNYRGGFVAIDADSQSANELGQRRIKRIFARWQPSANSSVVQRHAQRTLKARTKNLFEIQFQLERKDENIATAQFCDMTTIYLIDAFGLPVTTRIQVLRANAAGEVVSYRAREDFFKGAFLRWAPESLNGLL